MRAGRRSSPQSPRAREYPALADATIAGHPPGSSAGGERPKFGVFADGRHLLVKFAARDGAGGAAARRWCDLLILEALALQAVSSHGIPAATSTSWKHRHIGFWRASGSIAWAHAGAWPC